jgi:hypothetical protein
MIVSLYIKTFKYQDLTNASAIVFRDRVIADGGVFEAFNCCEDILNDLGGTAGYFDTFNRIELFNDEKISVTSSIQNINDISKVFTDYSQTFTIPASDNNNEIFRHWYENSLEDGYDQNLRYDGYIEIDTQNFRKGKWQLESATIKNNRVEDYKITFYGNLLSLTDKFKEDRLKDVETLNDYTFSYSGASVKTKVKDTLLDDVMFPLITSDRVWESTGVTTNNILSPAGAVIYTDLFPALKVSKVFEALESKYGITFTGSFLSDERFDKAYVWMKNNEARSLNFASIPTLITYANNMNGWFNLIDNRINVVRFFDGANSRYNGVFNLNITFATSNTYTLRVYKDNDLFTSLSATGTNVTFQINQSMGLGVYYFEIQTGVATTYTYTYNAKYYQYSSSGGTTEFTILSGSAGSTASSNIDLTNNAPDIRVTDFFTGILKMFNLTAYSEDGVNFTLQQLEDWYYEGQIKDFSQYCVFDSLDFERIKPYKKVNFEYEKSESFINRNFWNTNAREYGNLTYQFNNDGSDYNIKLPFETLQMVTAPLFVGYALKPDFVPYKPKPIILYYSGNVSTSIYFNDGSSTASLVTANLFSNDMQDSNQDLEKNTLNFGLEYSTVYGGIIDNTLFANYYLEYLNNLYSIKSRMLKIKMRLPYSELLNLQLNDRIVIRDKRYVINQYTTDLTTFESDFELIQDFRTIDYDNSTVRITDNTVKIIRFNTVSAEPLTWSIEYDPDGMITGLTEGDTYLDVQVKQNIGPERNCGIRSNLGDLIIIIQNA